VFGSCGSSVFGVMVIPLFLVLWWPQSTPRGTPCLSNIAQTRLLNREDFTNSSRLSKCSLGFGTVMAFRPRTVPSFSVSAMTSTERWQSQSVKETTQVLRVATTNQHIRFLFALSSITTVTINSFFIRDNGAGKLQNGNARKTLCSGFLRMP
jgi:hypothetical protein